MTERSADLDLNQVARKFFASLFERGEGIRFRVFMNDAATAGGFATRFQKGDKSIWALFETAEAVERHSITFKKPIFIIRDGPEAVLVPEEFDEYPIWRLKDNSLDD